MLLTLILNLGMAAGTVVEVPPPSVNVGGGRKPQVRTVSGDTNREKILREDLELIELIKEFCCSSLNPKKESSVP